MRTNRVSKGFRRRTGPATAAILGAVAVCISCASTTDARIASGESVSTMERGVSFRRADAGRLTAKTSIISYPVRHDGRTWHTAGVLNVPYSTAQTPRPAVVLVHGSGGVDSRGAGYAEALNRAGFVTLEIDLWAPRHVRSAATRPRSVSETLPDAYGALAFLSAATEDVDSRRIGITGFSWGGVVSMLSATRANRDLHAAGDQAFAAHAPVYPVCWVYNKVPGYAFFGLTGAPVFIQAGTADTYDTPDSCQTLQGSLSAHDQPLVRVKVYADATHAWDRREPDATIVDPYSHLGAGGEVPLRYSETTTRQSTNALVDFFRATLDGAR
ncbi:MAG: dienelactone hydrolase family protein [Hyphomonadaceae bacterium]|nr:MAG: hypothetical protein FD160_3725 [Caulobacteraceae bacterium]MBT9447665.1 dienelactone hydrolase family protein [Hyphomonadaceae bacterium]TPW05215.1 MAG: hypothetical protein FD124_2252 [Alphaproteobacteria bacterium]